MYLEIMEKEKKISDRIRRCIFIIIGSISLGLGMLGTMIPFLPTFPFLCVTLVCYGRSSRRLHKWFISSGLYQNHLEPMIHKRAVHLKTKLSLICCFTMVIGIGLFLMRNIFVGQVILAVVWISHMILFTLRIKTIKRAGGNETSRQPNMY